MFWHRTIRVSLLVALGLHLGTSRAHAETPLLVPTMVRGTVTLPTENTENAGQGVQLQLVQFAGKSWDRKHWATIACSNDGTINTVTTFPVTPSTVEKILAAAKGKTSLTVPMTFRVLTSDGQPYRLKGRLVVQLIQIGRDPWPPGSVIRLQGTPDDMGYIWAKVQFPVNAVTVNNLALMAQGQGWKTP